MRESNSDTLFSFNVSSPSNVFARSSRVMGIILFGLLLILVTGCSSREGSFSGNSYESFLRQVATFSKMDRKFVSYVARHSAEIMKEWPRNGSALLDMLSSDQSAQNYAALLMLSVHEPLNESSRAFPAFGEEIHRIYTAARELSVKRIALLQLYNYNQDVALGEAKRILNNVELFDGGICFLCAKIYRGKEDWESLFSKALNQCIGLQPEKSVHLKGELLDALAQAESRYLVPYHIESLNDSLVIERRPGSLMATEMFLEKKLRLEFATSNILRNDPTYRRKIYVLLRDWYRKNKGRILNRNIPLPINQIPKLPQPPDQPFSLPD